MMIRQFILFFTLFLLFGETSFGSPKLKDNFPALFSHKKHTKAFKEIGVSCQDCHRFSIKPLGTGPIGQNIKSKVLKASKKVCHQCHLGKISVPKITQCNLCHQDGARGLMPKNHKFNWDKKHGRMAQMDRDSCTACHQKNGCSECHMRRDNMNPRVHKGNFRYTHAIKARANPASCTTCHRSGSFCIDCHTGKRR